MRANGPLVCPVVAVGSGGAGCAVIAIGFDNFKLGLPADCDLLRLHRFGHFAHQIDDQQAIFQIGGFHADIIGQFEAAFKPAIGDADMEHIALSRGLLALAALHGEQILLRGNIEIGGFEPGHGQRDPVSVFAAALDIEWGVIFARTVARLVFENVEQAVKTHGAAAIGGEIKT